MVINLSSFNLKSKPYEVGTLKFHITQKERLRYRDVTLSRSQLAVMGRSIPGVSHLKSWAVLPTPPWLNFADFLSVHKLVLSGNVNVA